MYFVIMDDIIASNKHYSHYDVVSLAEFQSLVAEVGTVNAVAFSNIDDAANHADNCVFDDRPLKHR